MMKAFSVHMLQKKEPLLSECGDSSTSSISIQQNLEKYCGVEVPSKVHILPPEQAKNKGSGSRISSGRDVSMAASHSGRRRCGRCNKYATHNSRICTKWNEIRSPGCGFYSISLSTEAEQQPFVPAHSKGLENSNNKVLLVLLQHRSTSSAWSSSWSSPWVPTSFSELIRLKVGGVNPRGLSWASCALSRSAIGLQPARSVHKNLVVNNKSATE
ncbi:hypothetical protein V2J09_021503 [Rumex salicifolius]